MHVGALCREMTNTAVAEAEQIHDSTVKTLDTIYMQPQVVRAGLPAPRAIGVDEFGYKGFLPGCTASCFGLFADLCECE